MSSFLNLGNVLPGVELPIFQRQGMQRVFVNKRMLLAFDTGTGKTFTYSGVVRGLLNRNPEKKHILIVINAALSQITQDVRNLVRVPVAWFDGTSASASRLQSAWRKNSIFILTMEALRIEQLVSFLFLRLGEVESLTIDEAHHCANWDQSDTAFMVRALCQYVPYVIELSATPMTRESKQYYRLMNILDRTRSRNRDETYLGKYVDRYMAVNRADYEIKGNYHSELVLVQPTLEQLGKSSGYVFRKLKGHGATNQIAVLSALIQERLEFGKRILVFVYYHDSREWVEENFIEKGISFVSIHGRVKRGEEREYLLDQFRSGAVDVLITSITEALNIEADTVIFYEFTTLVKQVIGRAHRGVQGKELEILFIITRDSAEVDYFMKYIYARSLTIQKLLGKDYSELIAIGEQLEKVTLDGET